MLKKFGATYEDLSNRINMSEFEWFLKNTINKWQIAPVIKKLIEQSKSVAKDIRETIDARYIIEYANAQKLEELLRKAGLENCCDQIADVLKGDETYYAYYNALMDPSLFASITGDYPEELSDKTIFDVWAGSGTLLQKLQQYGAKPENMTGIDLSMTSNEKIRNLWYNALHGTLYEVRDQVQNQADVVLLSYFIDRDIDQVKTFETTVQMLKPQWKIIFEWWLPSKPEDTNGIQYTNQQDTLITKGETLEEDIDLICTRLQKIGYAHNKNIIIDKVVTTRRAVYSADGMEILPSCYIVATNDI